ncbi:hypothetical protein AeMF1_009627 [Aphanomyces euteiches]|nr:hypothetical protein AeMF1_009627 [Aphanomyces euteiches]
MPPRRKKICGSNPKLLELLGKNQDSHDPPSLLSRIVSSDPRRLVRGREQMERKKIHEAQKSFELPHCALIDTPDKLLEYALEIITTKSDVDLRRIRLKEVHTLAEAIFAPQRKPVEITYLIYDLNPPCKFSNIYWLVPAPVDTLNLKSHYFTMTSFGLTNVTNADNGMITARPTSLLTCIYLEIYDLSTWLSEKAIFDKIARMPSIQLMRKMNVFHTWKRNTIGMRFVRARKFLTDKLLWCHPSLAPFVCSIRPLVMKVGEKAISPIVDPTRSLFFSDLIPRDRNQQTRDLQEVVSRIEGILLNALTPLVGEHSRYSDHATSSHFVPAFVRVVDFMVVEALFEALCSSISHLSCSISGLPTDQQTLKSSFKCRSDDDCSEDLYTQIDALLARPFEHSGNITYKRLFQLQGAVRPPDPLFILKIAIHNTHITIIPEKELWVRKFRDMIADYISALDRVERISANSKIQDFVHKYCRPYFRHFFAESIQSFSTIVNNHVSIETMMKDLRTTLDIYFAEVEHLTSSCLPLKAEFLQIEKTTPPLSQGTLESVSYVTRIVQTHITLRRELQAADMMLLVGCFLVDRSIFVGEMLAKCNNKLLELYQELLKFCNHFFKRVVDDLAKKTAILVSIPESVEECTEWLACFCGLQSHTRSPVIHMGPCVSSLQQMVDSCRNDCPPELSSNLVNSFESGHLLWKIQNKALREILSRIEDNRSFYQELLSRTLSSRREILLTELCTVSSKLNEAIKAVNIFGSDQDGFGGPDVQNLVKIARGLLDRNDLLTRLTSFLDQFVHLNSSKTKDSHLCRYSSFRSGSGSHLFKVYDHVSAVMALLDIAHSFVQFRQSFERVPLIDLDLSSLLARVVSLKRLAQPHCATLDGMHHPLVSQLYPSVERLQDALEMAIPMTQSQFTPERWKIIENILSLTQNDKCDISHIEAGLSKSTTKELLGKLSSAASQEAQIHSTLNQVKSQISGLSLDFTANDHGMRVTNCLEITSSLADCRMILLRIRHHENPWLVEVHRLESQISDATDLINLIHEMDSTWNQIAVALAMPELKSYEKDPELWADVELIGRTWQDCLVAGCYWNDQASSHFFIKLETIFKPLDLPHYIRQCERMRASIWSYFQTLRIAFPRLYMISNHDMLAMFNEPNRVQVVIKRCYLGIKLVECSDIKNVPESKTHIAGMMDSDFMTWLLGDHSVSFIHSVQFAGCSWTLPLFRPVKILGPLAFWLGQFDTLLNHSLTAKAITAMSQFAYDPKSTSPIDQIKEWTTKLPPQLILNFIHVHFCTLVERLIVSAPGTTSGRTLLQSSAANQRDYIQRLVSHVRTSNGQNTVIEDTILLLSCQQDTLYQLAAHAETYDWSNVMLTWEHTFRLVANGKSDELSIEARIGQVSVPCGLELQPTMSWIAILPTTQRCIFALFHVMRLNVSIMPTGEARMGKKTLLRSLGYLLMRPQWELICHHNTSVSDIESFTKGIESLHGWGHVLCASNLTAAVLGGFVSRMREMQESLISSAQVSENFRCVFFLMNQGINVHSSLARWVGQPLRPLAILPPDQFLLLKALFSAKGFSVDKNVKLVDCVLRTLYAASTSVVSQCRFRLLHNVVNTAYKITKEVNYVIHSHGKHGSHVKHDASPLNVARYKDTNVFRFALLLVLEPLGFVSSSQLHTVLDQFIPSNLTLTQENRTFASAFKVVLDRGHFAPEAKFIESGVALHHMLKSGTPTIVVGRTISGKTTCLKNILRAQQLVESLYRPNSNGNAHIQMGINMSVIGLDDLEDFQEMRQILTNALTPTQNVINCVCAIFQGHDHAQFPDDQRLSLKNLSGRLLLVLELASLDALSPSLITSCNVLCTDSIEIKWHHLVQRWLKQYSRWPTVSSFDVLEFTSEVLVRCIEDFALPFQGIGSPLSLTILIAHALRLLQTQYDSITTLTIDDDGFFEQIIFLAVVWGVGSPLSSHNRSRFQAFVQHTLDMKRPAMTWLNIDTLLTLCLQSSRTIFDLKVDFEENRVIIADHNHHSFVARDDFVYVHTPQTMYAEMLSSTLFQNGVSTMLIGLHGSGKTSLLKYLTYTYSTDKSCILISTSSRNRVDALKRYLLHTSKVEVKVAFIDDLGLDDRHLRKIKLLRHSMDSKRVFCNIAEKWKPVNPIICGSIDEAHLSNFGSDVKRSRALRHFFLIQLPDLSESDMKSIQSHLLQVKLGRNLTIPESWFISATISLVFQLRQCFDDKLPQYQFSMHVIEHIMSSLVDICHATESHSSLIQSRWLLELKSFLWDSLTCENHKQDMVKRLNTITAGKVRVEVIEMQNMIWKLPWLTELPLNLHSTRGHEVREYIISAYDSVSNIHCEIDTMWLRTTNSSHVLHWIKVHEAFRTRKQIFVVGQNWCEDHENIVKLVACLSSVSYISSHSFESQDDVAHKLSNLCEIAGVNQKRVILSICDSDLLKWTYLLEFVQDFLQGLSVSAAEDYVFGPATFTPAAAYNSPGGVVNLLKRRMQMNVCVCIYFSTASSQLETLLMHRKIPATIFSVSPSDDSRINEYAFDYITEIARMYPLLGVSPAGVTALAKACVEIHTAISKLQGLSHSVPFTNLLDTFKHLVNLKVSLTHGIQGGEGVDTAVQLLENLLVSYTVNQQKISRWTIANELCRERQTFLKKAAAAVEAKLIASRKSLSDMDLRLQSLQRNCAEYAETIETEERQIRIDRNALESLIVVPLDAAGKDLMLGDWKEFLPVVRMSSALCLLFNRDEYSVDTAVLLMVDQNFASKLLFAEVRPEVLAEYEQLLNLAPADIALLHTKRPLFATVMRWLMFKLSFMTAHEKIQLYRNNLRETTSAIESLENCMQDASKELSELEESSKVIHALREELGMESAEAKINLNCFKRESSRLAPLQSFISHYIEWLRAKYIARNSLSSCLSCLLYFSSVITFGGVFIPNKLQQLSTTIASVLTRHGYFLPLELNLVGDGPSNLVSVLESHLFVGHLPMDKLLRDELIMCDWSCQTPLFVDPFGVAEMHLVQFFKRMQLSLPDINHIVVSCRDSRLLEILQDAMVHGKLVVVTHFALGFLNVIEPFLQHQRMPLIHHLLASQCKRVARHGTSIDLVTSRAVERLLSIRSLKESDSKGFFQVYLTVVDSPSLNPRQKSLFNIFNCNLPRQSLKALLLHHLPTLLGPAHHAIHDCVDLTNLQLYVELHAMQSRLLQDMLHMPTLDHLVKLITKHELRRKSLEAKLSNDSVPESSSHMSSSLTSSLNTSAELTAIMMQALWHIRRFPRVYLVSIPYIQKTIAVITDNYIHNHAILSEADKCRLIDYITKQIYVIILSSIPREYNQLFQLSVAIMNINSPLSFDQVMRFVGNVNVDEGNTDEKEMFSRRKSISSCSNTTASQLHRVRSIQSIGRVPDPANDQYDRNLMATWGSSDMYVQLRYFESLFPDCKGIEKHVRKHETVWLSSVIEYLQSSPPHFIAPLCWPSPFSTLQILLLVKCICPDMLAVQLDYFVTQTLPRNLTEDSITLCLNTIVLLIAESNYDLPPSIDLLGVDLSNRVLFTPFDPKFMSSFAELLDTAMAKGGSLIVELLNGDNFHPLHAAILQTLHQHKRTTGHIFLLLSADVVANLPLDFVQGTQKVLLPLTMSHLLVKPSKAPLVARETAPIQNSVAGKLARGLRSLQLELQALNTWHAIGWWKFTARVYHFSEAARALRYIADAESKRCPSSTSSVVSSICHTIQKGILEADACLSHDDALIERAVKRWTDTTGRFSPSRPSQILPTSFSLLPQIPSAVLAPFDNHLALGVSSRTALYLRNSTTSRASMRFISCCRVLVPYEQPRQVSDMDISHCGVTRCLHVFKSFLRQHYAYDESIPTATTPLEQVGAKGAAMALVAAIKFRRSIKTQSRPSNSLVALLLEDLDGLNKLLLSFVSSLECLKTRSKSDADRMLLDQGQLPPQWFGLPATASTVSLAAWIDHLNSTSAFFTRVSHESTLSGSIPLAVLTSPQQFLAKIRLQYAVSVACDLDELHLVLEDSQVPHEKESLVPVTIEDDNHRLCGVIASGLYIFDGSESFPLIHRLPPVRLRFALKIASTAVAVPCCSLWSLLHFGELPLMGDSPMYTSLGTVWVDASWRFIRSKTESSPHLNTLFLCPVMDNQLNAVSLLDKSYNDTNN